MGNQPYIRLQQRLAVMQVQLNAAVALAHSDNVNDMVCLQQAGN